MREGLLLRPQVVPQNPAEPYRAQGLVPFGQHPWLSIRSLAGGAGETRFIRPNMDREARQACPGVGTPLAPKG